ncbi:MAG: hypothetical protein IPG50_12590 [Myxococcales bacterium]|nr:hypothetical protein [Myxococcales bacterium]
MAPAPRAAALAKACAPGAAAGAPAASLALGDSAAAAAVPFAAEAGACYRFAVAAEPKVEGFVLVVMDANGGVALEAKTDDALLFAPADGPLCFSSSSASRVLVSARRGAGTGALQVVRVRD